MPVEEAGLTKSFATVDLLVILILCVGYYFHTCFRC